MILVCTLTVFRKLKDQHVHLQKIMREALVRHWGSLQQLQDILAIHFWCGWYTLCVIQLRIPYSPGSTQKIGNEHTRTQKS